jgi:aminoglycoside phosphotransferase
MEIKIIIGEEEKEEEEMPTQRTPFQRKVARMLAKMAGRSKPNEKDMEMAAELEHEKEED